MRARRVFRDAHTRQVDPGFRGKLPATSPPSELVEALTYSDWDLLLICGPTGSGKTRLGEALAAALHFPPPPLIELPVSAAGPQRAIVSHPSWLSSAHATEGLGMCSFSSVPAWLRPQACLSGGQRARTDVALLLQRGSVLVEDVGARLGTHDARMLSAGVGRTARSRGLKRVVVTTRCLELCSWMQPDLLVILGSDGYTMLRNPTPHALRRPLVELRLDLTKLDTAKSPSSLSVDRRREGERPWLRVAKSRMLSCDFRKAVMRTTVLQDAATASVGRMFDLAWDGTCVTKLSPSPFSPADTGQKHMAVVARALAPADADAGGIILIDEFTSDLDAPCARRMGTRVAAFVRSCSHVRVVYASVRESTLADTQPDWLYDVKTDRFDVFQYDGMPLAPPPALPPVECTAEKLFARPVIRGTGQRVESKRAVVCWEQLPEHHYLSSNLLTLAYQHCWALRMDDDPTRALAAFVALSRDEMHTAKQGDSRKRYKEQRLVVDRQWQGIGLGPRFSLMVCMNHATADRKETRRIFAVTGHRALAEQRKHSGSWKLNKEGWQVMGDNLANTSTVSRYLFHFELRDDLVRAAWSERWGAGGALRPLGTLPQLMQPPAKRHKGWTHGAGF